MVRTFGVRVFGKAFWAALAQEGFARAPIRNAAMRQVFLRFSGDSALLKSVDGNATGAIVNCVVTNVNI